MRRKSMGHLVAWCLVFALSWPAASSPVEPAPYGYDITIVKKASEDPQLEIHFNISRVGDEHEIWPRLRAWGLPECPKKWFSDLIGHGKLTWKEIFDLSCSGLTPRSGRDTAGWRLRLIDSDRRAVEPSVSEVIFALPPAELSESRPNQMNFSGLFEANGFSIDVLGYSMVNLWWQEDEAADGLARYVLVAEVKPEAQTAKNPHPDAIDPAPTSTGSDRPSQISETAGQRPDPPPPQAEEESSTTAVTPDASIPQSAELRRLSVSLEGRGASRDWPPLVVWLSPSKHGPWQVLHLREEAQRGREFSVKIPSGLVGKDVLVQVAALEKGGPEALHFELADGTLTRRLKVPGVGAASHRLIVKRPLRVWHELEVMVRGPRGAAIAGATVALQSVSRRDRTLEHTSAVSNNEGRTRHVLTRPEAFEIWVVCAKDGWSNAIRLLERPIPRRFECSLEPLEDSRPAEPEGPALLLSGKILDASSGRPLNGAEMQVHWPGESEAHEVLVRAGAFMSPTPSPVPAAAHIEVKSRCYEPFSQRLALPLEGPIRLRYRCREAGLSLRLVQIGAKAPVLRARQALASVYQGDELRVSDIGFDEAGYSEVKDFLFDPSGGTVRVEVTAPGYAEEAFEIEDLGSRLGEVGIVSDIEVELRPEGHGLAILLNAAQRWTLYPQARDGVVELLRSVEVTQRPDQLVFGLLAGSFKQVSAGADTGLNSHLSWLRGLSATGGQLTPTLLESRLGEFGELWPQASSWDVVLVIPHNDLAASERLAEEQKQRIVESLQSQKVVLHVIEDGGLLPIYTEVAGSLGGSHESLEGDEPALRIKALKSHLLRIFAGSTGEKSRDAN